MSKESVSMGVTAGVLVGQILIFALSHNAMNSRINENKKKLIESDISAKNIKKIDSQINKINDNFTIDGKIERTLEWQKAVDSIKTEGLVKKAYMEGQQAVRDSLSKAAKVRP